MTFSFNLNSGDLVRPTTLVNLRRTPGYLSKPAGDIIVEVTPNHRLRVLSATMRTVDGLNWWQVAIAEGEGAGTQGWIAETAPGSGVALLERITIPVESGLRVGDSARTVTAVNLRRSPGFRNQPVDHVIATLPAESRVRIVDGPHQVDGLIWWQVETMADSRSLSGWMAERGVDGAPLLVPTDSIGGFAAFRRGDLVTTRVALRVRRNPGHLNVQPGDVLGVFWPGTTLFVHEGPRQADGLTWWLVSGIATDGEAVTGWVAQQLADGTVLVDHPPTLPGTAIPTSEQNRYLGSPYQGRRPISQLFGRNPNLYGQYSYEGIPLRGHNAVDIAMPIGIDLWAVDSGIISQVGFDPPGYGNYVMIQHPWGESLYAHLSQVNVRTGQQVGRGQGIGQSGNTGASTGPHLHFSIRINPYRRGDGWGGFSDPLPYLPPDSYTLPSYVQREAERTISALSFEAESLPPTPLSPDDPNRPRP
jgi:hypothetical protein